MYRVIARIMRDVRINQGHIMYREIARANNAQQSTNQINGVFFSRVKASWAN